MVGVLYSYKLSSLSCRDDHVVQGPVLLGFPCWISSHHFLLVFSDESLSEMLLICFVISLVRVVLIFSLTVMLGCFFVSVTGRGRFGLYLMLRLRCTSSPCHSGTHISRGRRRSLLLFLSSGLLRWLLRGFDRRRFLLLGWLSYNRCMKRRSYLWGKFETFCYLNFNSL